MHFCIVYENEVKKSKLIKVTPTFLSCVKASVALSSEGSGTWIKNGGIVDHMGIVLTSAEAQFRKSQHKEKPYRPVASKLLDLGKQDTICLESLSGD